MAETWSGFFCLFGASGSSDAKYSRQCVSKGLWAKLSFSEVRKAYCVWMLSQWCVSNIPWNGQWFLAIFGDAHSIIHIFSKMQYLQEDLESFQQKPAVQICTFTHVARLTTNSASAITIEVRQDFALFKVRQFLDCLQGYELSTITIFVWRVFQPFGSILC